MIKVCIFIYELTECIYDISIILLYICEIKVRLFLNMRGKSNFRYLRIQFTCAGNRCTFNISRIFFGRIIEKRSFVSNFFFFSHFLPIYIPSGFMKPLLLLLLILLQFTVIVYYTCIMYIHITGQCSSRRT